MQTKYFYKYLFFLIQLFKDAWFKDKRVAEQFILKKDLNDFMFQNHDLLSSKTKREFYQSMNKLSTTDLKNVAVEKCKEVEKSN